MNHRILRGFLFGVVATIAMTIVHILILVIVPRMTGAPVMPKPIPEVLIGKIFGPGLSKSILVFLAAMIHLGYGGFWGGILFALTPRVTVWKGVAMGAFLYLLMQLFLLPFLGWGVFGGAIPQKIAIGSLATHFTYGVTLGWLGGRKRPAPTRG